MLFDFVTALLLGFWIRRIAHFLPSSLRDLPSLEPKIETERISIIVAARNEDEHIEASVRALLAQDWPQLELIVVNDRSTDQTAVILERLQLSFPQLRVIDNHDLPSGWLGKCWALQRGAKLASGHWLLFCDADVVMQSDTLRRVLACCQSEGHEHISLIPEMRASSLWLSAVQVSLSFLFFLFQNTKDIFAHEKPGVYMGVGAFNMIRSDLYERLGGHETLRLEVVDDVMLGMLAKRHGGRSAFFLGYRFIWMEWYAGLGAYIKGLEKNSFAGLHFSWLLLSLAILGQSLIFFFPLLVLARGETWSSLFALGSIGIQIGLSIQNCVRQGLPWTRGLLLWPSILIQFYTFLRSAILITKRGGIVWRDNFYALSELKAAQRSLRGYWYK